MCLPHKLASNFEICSAPVLLIVIIYLGVYLLYYLYFDLQLNKSVKAF